MSSVETFVNAQPRAARFVVLGVVLVLALTAYRLGILGRFASPSLATATLLGLGAWGYLAFVLAYAVLQPIGVPGTAFIMAAPLVWPWPVAFALSMTGTMAASVVGFALARFVARDWLSPRIPMRFRRYDEALAARGFTTVFLLRFIFWMPPLLHAFFGVSRVRFWTHFWGSFVGYLIPLFLVSFYGRLVFDVLSRLTLTQWVAVVGVFAALLFAGYVWRHRRNTKARGRFLGASGEVERSRPE